MAVSLQRSLVAAAVGVIKAVLELEEALVGFLLLCKPLKNPVS